MTEEEILKYIEIATGNQSTLDFFKENPDLACRGWLTYVGLRQGTVKIHEDDLWMAAGKFFAAKGMDLPDRDLWLENITLRLKKYTDSPAGRIYMCSRRLSTILYLAEPSKKDWYGLSRKGLSRKVEEFADQDYIDKLSVRDQLWLSKFNDEYYKTRLRKDDTDLHQTQEEQRSLYAMHNSIRRDVFAKCQVGNDLVSCVDEYEAGYMTWNYLDDNSQNHVEDALIEYIDYAYSQEKKDD